MTKENRLNKRKKHSMQNLVHRRTETGQWMQGCEHTTKLLNVEFRNWTVSEIVDNLTEVYNNFDTIACCGTSGLLVVPKVCEILKKNILVVRKQKEKRYSPFSYEGAIPKNYIIVDDLICTGSTARHIVQTINKDCPLAICAGIYIFFKDKCSYKNNPDLCKKELGINYL